LYTSFSPLPSTTSHFKPMVCMNLFTSPFNRLSLQARGMYESFHFSSQPTASPCLFFAHLNSRHLSLQTICTSLHSNFTLSGSAQLFTLISDLQKSTLSSLTLSKAFHNSQHSSPSTTLSDLLSPTSSSPLSSTLFNSLHAFQNSLIISHSLHTLHFTRFAISGPPSPLSSTLFNAFNTL
jgi:hypothetical protein